MTLNPIEPALFTVTESSQVGDVRRQAHQLAEHLSFSEVVSENCALIVNELAKNLVKHSRTGGLMIVQPVKNNNTAGMEIISMDKDAGMQNVDKCLADGFSSTGTLGHGLGAVKRLSTKFDIYSSPGDGTVIVSTVYAEKPTATTYDIGAITVPKEGQLVCGDAYAVVQTQYGVALTVVDGLGHGYDASLASKSAVRAFLENKDEPAAEILRSMHRAASGGRGAVGAVAVIDDRKKILQFAGLGNINALTYDYSKAKHLVSHNGTLGYEARRFEQFELPWETGNLLIMHSDGCSHRWNLNVYPGIINRSSTTVASLLFRDHGKSIDDITICALRY